MKQIFDMVKIFFIAMMVIVGLSVAGCSTTRPAAKTGPTYAELAELEDKVKALESENDAKQKEIDELKNVKATKDTELSELEKAQQELEKRLKGELDQYKAKLEMTERGLVLTFMAEVFFDPGKSDIKEDAKPVLQQVAEVLNTKVADLKVAVEGHTDNDPIKYSGWKSNWELASARALAVLHYFVDDGNVKPERVSANSYGEFRPVAANDSPENKKKNRRVEVIILPTQQMKIAK
ncbi:MAG TPA: flagellar motor protein MotB [Candidatus Omnitrophota bacterium]|nr:flagellar motor protein MotB [Candidatus Omnitrophota bacterium]HPS20647.1 flagellar motor protein MotB [Candidatus Omnitrophota bacterium]